MPVSLYLEILLYEKHSGIILVGQILIVEFGGKVFRTEPMNFMTWVYIIAGTSFVLWIGEIYRWIKRIQKKD